jgi:hypothetical protein
VCWELHSGQCAGGSTRAVCDSNKVCAGQCANMACIASLALEPERACISSCMDGWGLRVRHCRCSPHTHADLPASRHLKAVSGQVPYGRQGVRALWNAVPGEQRVAPAGRGAAAHLLLDAGEGRRTGGEESEPPWSQLHAHLIVTISVLHLRTSGPGRPPPRQTHACPCMFHGVRGLKSWLRKGCHRMAASCAHAESQQICACMRQRAADATAHPAWCGIRCLLISLPLVCDWRSMIYLAEIWRAQACTDPRGR